MKKEKKRVESQIDLLLTLNLLYSRDPNKHPTLKAWFVTEAFV